MHQNLEYTVSFPQQIGKHQQWKFDQEKTQKDTLKSGNKKIS